MILRRFVPVVLSLGLVACSGASDSQTSTPTSPTEPHTVAPRPSDGTLRIGVLVPTQILDATQRTNLRAVLESATRVINANGGFQGSDIVVAYGDEEQSSRANHTAFDTMTTDDNVDAIIGLSSSVAAGELIPDAVRRGVGVCSPVATSVLLSSLPSDNDLVIRTTPSDAALARVLGDIVVDSGYGTAALVYPDDAYGRALATIVAARLVQKGVNTTNPGTDAESVNYPYTLPLSQDDEIRFADISARKVVFIGSAEAAAVLLPRFVGKDIYSVGSMIDLGAALSSARSGTPQLEVDGDLTRGLSASVALDPFATAAQQIAALAALDPQLPVGISPDLPFVTAFVDCLNLLALSANAAASDQATAFMPLARETASVGTPCSSYAECATAIAQSLNVDYEGISGSLDLDQNGDATSTLVWVRTFAPDGRQVSLTATLVTSTD